MVKLHFPKVIKIRFISQIHKPPIYIFKTTTTIHFTKCKKNKWVLIHWFLKIEKICVELYINNTYACIWKYARAMNDCDYLFWRGEETGKAKVRERLFTIYLFILWFFNYYPFWQIKGSHCLPPSSTALLLHPIPHPAGTYASARACARTQNHPEIICGRYAFTFFDKGLSPILANVNLTLSIHMTNRNATCLCRLSEPWVTSTTPAQCSITLET